MEPNLSSWSRRNRMEIWLLQLRSTSPLNSTDSLARMKGSRPPVSSTVTCSPSIRLTLSTCGKRDRLMGFAAPNHLLRFCFPYKIRVFFFIIIVAHLHPFLSLGKLMWLILRGIGSPPMGFWCGAVSFFRLIFCEGTPAADTAAQEFAVCVFTLHFTTPCCFRIHSWPVHVCDGWAKASLVVVLFAWRCVGVEFRPRWRKQLDLLLGNE